MRDIAIKYYKFAIDVCPENYASYYYWARFNISTSIYQIEHNSTPFLSLELFSDALQRASNPSLKLLISYYLKYIKSGKTKAALSRCTEALQLDENNSEAQLQYGILLYKTEQYERALEAYSHCENLPSRIKYEISILKSFVPLPSAVKANNPYYFVDFDKKSVESKIAKLEAKSSDVNPSLGVLYYNLGRYYIDRYSTKSEESLAVNYLTLAVKHKRISPADLQEILDKTERRLLPVKTRNIDPNVELYASHFHCFSLFSSYRLAIKYINKNQFESAMLLFNSIEKEHPNDTRLIQLQGNLHAYLGKLNVLYI